MSEVKVGDVVSERSLPTLDGEVKIPDASKLVHLKFVRFAGCPACSYQLRSIAKALPKLEAANVKEVVVFHSSAEELREYENVLPFVFVPDPEKKLYKEFGADRTEPKPFLRPSVLMRLPLFASGVIMGKSKPPPDNPLNGRDGLLADFLIKPDGKVAAVKYGETMIDGWSAEEIVAHAKAASVYGSKDGRLLIYIREPAHY